MPVAPQPPALPPCLPVDDEDFPDLFRRERTTTAAVCGNTALDTFSKDDKPALENDGGNVRTSGACVTSALLAVGQQPLVHSERMMHRKRNGGVWCLYAQGSQYAAPCNLPHENVVGDHVHELHVFQSVVGETSLVLCRLSPNLGFQQPVSFVRRR